MGKCLCELFLCLSLCWLPVHCEVSMSVRGLYDGHMRTTVFQHYGLASPVDLLYNLHGRSLTKWSSQQSLCSVLHHMIVCTLSFTMPWSIYVLCCFNPINPVHSSVISLHYWNTTTLSGWLCESQVASCDLVRVLVSTTWSITLYPKISSTSYSFWILACYRIQNTTCGWSKVYQNRVHGVVLHRIVKVLQKSQYRPFDYSTYVWFCIASWTTLL